MNGEQLSKALGILKYTDAAFAEAVGYKDRNTVRRWRAGQSKIPKLIAHKVIRELKYNYSLRGGLGTRKLLEGLGVMKKQTTNDNE